jgi:hypothetical protein
MSVELGVGDFTPPLRPGWSVTPVHGLNRNDLSPDGRSQDVAAG